MSLILDALKKSERERQERLTDDGPAPPRGRPPSSESGGKGRRWPVVAGLLAAVAIVGGAAGYRYLNQPRPVVVAQVAPVDTEPATPEVAEEPAAEPLAEAVPEPETQSEPLPEPISEPAAEPDPVVQASAEPPAPEPLVLPEPEPALETVPQPEPDPEPEALSASGSVIVEAEVGQTPAQPAADTIAAPPRKPAAPPMPAAAAVTATGPAADAADHYQRAVSLEQEGLLDQALAHYTEALTERPDFAEALYGRGWVQIARQSYDNAVRNFTDLIQLKPGMSPAYFGRGWAHELSGALDQAAEDYGSAIELSPDEPSLRFNRAILNIYREDFLAAERDLNAIRNRGNADEKTFAQVWQFVSRARSGVPSEDILPALRTTRAAGGWPGVVLDYMLDKATFDNVLAETVSDHYRETAARECIAYFFAAERARYAGDAADAANYYRLAIATEATEYRQYWAARLELDRMGIVE